jgi:hypothetical protein
MTYADVLLHIDSYPNPTTTAAVDEAVALAVSLGGQLTAMATEVDRGVYRTPRRGRRRRTLTGTVPPGDGARANTVR